MIAVDAIFIRDVTWRHMADASKASWARAREVSPDDGSPDGVSPGEDSPAPEASDEAPERAPETIRG
jgi:hypothetical protein